MIFACVGLGFVAVFVFASNLLFASGPWRDFTDGFGGLLLIAFAFFGVGSLVGLLFGIPRSLQSQRPAEQAPSSDNAPKASAAESSPLAGLAGNAPNTNLEQISDWLTKIIVGLGLVNLKQFPDYAKRLAAYFSGDLNGTISPNVMLAVILFFFVSGFFLGYLMTRLYLQILFTMTDVEEANNRRRIDALVENVAHQAANDPNIATHSHIGGIIESQRSTAKKIASIASPAQVNDLKQEVLNLAREYNEVRETQDPGFERTSRMEVIASRMRALALASYSLLDELVKGRTAGERLAAIAFLEVKPKIDYLEWLAQRVAVDQSFVGYHAALALRVATRYFGLTDYDRVSKALAAALTGLKTAPGYRTGTDREAVLNDAETLLASMRAKSEASPNRT